MPSASGQPGPTDIIGREAFIAHLWHVLRERSLILSAERRFGKTYVIQKMEAEPPSGVLTFYQDLEKISTAEDFSKAVYAKVMSQQRLSYRAVQGAAGWLSRWQGGKIAWKFPALGPHLPETSLDLPALAALPWQVKLTASITELVNSRPGLVVFFWDEMPWMVEHVTKKEGVETAQQVLELLRDLRQDPVLRPKLRMVYTGSIGFHHVLAAALADPLINDMKPPEYVPPLEAEHAQRLALRRLTHERIDAADPAEAAREIAEAVCGIPWYVNNLTQSLNALGRPMQAGDADARLVRLLRHSPEDWELPEYDRRLDRYYTPAQSRTARDLLDVLAVRDEVADFATLRNLLNAQRRIKDEEEVRHVLNLLRQDHYLSPDPYRFQLPLIRRFWRAHRGL